MWLVVAAAVFTPYFSFVQFRFLGHAISLVKGDYSDPKDAGEVSHFQALATTLSGAVGLGNIAGVAVAVGIDGPGATFWMVLAALMGMASKFTECTLGVKYRNDAQTEPFRARPCTTSQRASRNAACRAESF
ncbi:MAG: AGCS family alanine or glycine:cation symporter [Gammaproteobacteria bacterium]|jgi:AGCS family alanine or glycine:cation symporter